MLSKHAKKRRTYLKIKRKDLSSSAMPSTHSKDSILTHFTFLESEDRELFAAASDCTLTQIALNTDKSQSVFMFVLSSPPPSSHHLQLFTKHDAATWSVQNVSDFVGSLDPQFSSLANELKRMRIGGKELLS